MQALIHGNFPGAAQKKAYALVGAAAAVAAAVGPLLGGFITTYLSWRGAVLLREGVIILVPSRVKPLPGLPFTRGRGVGLVRAGVFRLAVGGGGPRRLVF